MQVLYRISIIGSALALLTIISCSSAKKDYEKLQELQTSSEQLLEHASSREAVLNVCDSVIVALNGYLEGHTDGDWATTARAALKSWQFRRDAYEKDFILRDEIKSYETLEQLQASTEQLLQHTTDFDVILAACDSVIQTLNQHLAKHKDGQKAAIMKTMLKAWQSRRSTFESEFTLLHEKLYDELKSKCTAAAQEHHRMSNFEAFTLDFRKKVKDNGKIVIRDTYDVRMKGALLGKHIFKFRVSATGFIDMVTNRISVADSVTIQE